MRIEISNIHCKLEIGGTDHLYHPNLMKIFREYMSVEVDGAFFINKHLPFHYDGKRYFITPKGKMATGFLPTFLRYLDREHPDLDVELKDNRGYFPAFSDTFVDRIGSVTITEEYIHQRHMIECYKHNIEFRGITIPFPRGIIDAATNAGKTAIMAGIYLNMKEKEKMLVIIHSKVVFKQLVDMMTDVFGEVGQINATKYIIKPVTIAMIQTLYSRRDDLNLRKDLNQFTILAYDEAHKSGSSQSSKVLVHCPAPMRVFVSGTAFDSSDTVNNLIAIGLSGPKLGGVSKKYLMDKKISTPVKVHMRVCNTVLDYPVLDYRECMDMMIHYSKERVDEMRKIILERTEAGPILIAVNFTQHGQFLMDELSKSLPEDILIEFSHGKDSDQVEKVEAFKQGQIDVLISTGILKEGVNLPLIQTLIYAIGEMAKVSVKQWMGRIERKHESKDVAMMYDFYDIGKFVRKHSENRLLCYQAENVEIELDFDIHKVKSLRTIIKRN